MRLTWIRRYFKIILSIPIPLGNYIVAEKSLSLNIVCNELIGIFV